MSKNVSSKKPVITPLVAKINAIINLYLDQVLSAPSRSGKPVFGIRVANKWQVKMDFQDDLKAFAEVAQLVGDTEALAILTMQAKAELESVKTKAQELLDIAGGNS